MPNHLEELAEEAIELARDLLRTAERLKTRRDDRQASLMAEMLARPANLAFTLELADRVFRPRSPERVAQLLSRAVERWGVPSFLSVWERSALVAGTAVSQVLPGPVVPEILRRVRAQSADLILDAEPHALTNYLADRRQAGFAVNVNLLGEAVLGDREAASRMERNLALVERPDVSHMSVKISSIVGRIRPHAFEASVESVCGQLRRLYRAGDRHTSPTFINLDMEAYEDLELTLASFQRVLSEPEFLSTHAGIVLQAYLPDSHAAQERLTSWARARVDRGGAPIRVRLVKGANLGMERVTSELHGWTPAPYPTKLDTDASFKRMVLYGVEAERARAVHLGIGSHNLFDVAFAMVAATRAGSLDHVTFEMLQGMASHQARAVLAQAGRLLVYAPIVADDDFVSAVAYLARRLEENTDAANYLRHVLSIGPEGSIFDEEADKFRAAVGAAPSVFSGRGRVRAGGGGWQNAADTDFTDPTARADIAEALQHWSTSEIGDLPLVIGGADIITDQMAHGFDPSRPNDAIYRYSIASRENMDDAIAAARIAQARWAALAVAERRATLESVARRIEEARCHLIGCMVRDAGKSVTQADAEVSEAVDMAGYYAISLDDTDLDGCRLEPFGVVTVAPPWNFPVAIPAGGILAALMAGNAVVLKPAPEAVLCSWELCSIMWSAGVPRTVLQFTPCRDDAVGEHLITSADAVILTGSHETGRLFTSWKPDMRLFAETSGKNAFIISATADLDQAIADLVDSAFGHAGQKCSASSLALVEGEVYDSAAFRRQLADAVESLTVGPAWDPVNDVTSLIGKPGPALLRGLTELDDGEEWLVEPTPNEGGGWTPGVRLGVREGSFFHETECFGPVLGVMRMDSTEHGLAVANRSLFGLTGGLHSLDDSEIAAWVDGVEVGNAYVNRTTTGAVVRRQPFGGWKQSVFGPGAKAGGPNYVLQMGTWHQDEPVPEQTSVELATGTTIDRMAGALNESEQAELRRALASQARAFTSHFARGHDPTGLRAESNIFRYRLFPDIIVRVTVAQPLEVGVVVGALATIGATYELSQSPDVDLELGATSVEDDAAFAARLTGRRFARVRHIGPVSLPVWEASRAAHVHVAADPVVGNGRLELRHYFREQSVSRKLHRHGMLPPVG